MSGRFVRASKYRHVFGEPARKDKCYTGFTPACVGDGNFIKANTRFFAVGLAGGGGPLLVHNLEKVGRFGHGIPVVNVHKAPVLDWDFSPFHENVIASASEDGTIKITSFPEEGVTANVEEAKASLEGHQKKVPFVHFHPTAADVIASASQDNTIRIWDVERQAEKFCQEFPDNVSFEWNRDGSMIGVACKDKTVRIFDPRAANNMVSGTSTQGAKGARLAWADTDRIVVVGFTATSARQFLILDTRKLGEPIKASEIDQGSGLFMPFFDFDNRILYLAGKGDAGVKYFEFEQDELHFLSEFRSNESQKGFGLLPKRACDTKVCEIARGFRVMKDGVEPVSFQVPRKSELFQEDIFPDTFAGVAALSGDEYFAGQNKDAPTVSMKPSAHAAPKPASTAKPSGGHSSHGHDDLAKAKAELDAVNHELAAKKTELEAARHELAKLKEDFAKLSHH